MVRKRGNSWVGTAYIEGQRVRRSFKTETEAIAFEQGRGLESRPMLTVKQAFTDAYEYHWRTSRDSKNAYRIVNELISLFGEDTLVTDVTTAEVRAKIFYWRSKGNTDKTINRKLSKISQCMKYARTTITDLELPETTRLKERKGRVRYLSEEEAERLLNSFDNEKYKRFATFLLHVGCRYSEATRLTWQDVTDTHVTFWMTKGDKPRTIPLTRKAAATLIRGAGGVRSDKPWNINYDAFHAAFMKAREKAGLGYDDQVVIHTLRHTCASWLVQKGVDIRRVRDWMGHSKIETTMIYAHLAPSDLDDAVRALEAE